MKYTLTITADNAAELRKVIDHLDPLTGNGCRTEVGVVSAEALPPLAEVLSRPVGMAPELAAPYNAGTSWSNSGATTVQVAAPAPVTPVAAPAPQLLDEDEDYDADGAPAVFAAPAPAPIPNVAAPVPSPVVTPAAPVVSTTHVGAGVELDPRGYPWDARIHSSSRARLTKDQTWKLIRGTAPALVEQVEAELRSKGYGQAQPGVAHPVVTQPQVTAAPAPTPVPSQVLPPALTPVTNGAIAVKDLLMKGIKEQVFKAPELKVIIESMGIEQINNLAQYQGDFAIAELAIQCAWRLTKVVQTGKASQAWLDSVAQFYGVSNILQLPSVPARIPEVVAYLDKNGM